MEFSRNCTVRVLSSSSVPIEPLIEADNLFRQFGAHLLGQTGQDREGRRGKILSGSQDLTAFRQR